LKRKYYYAVLLVVLSGLLFLILRTEYAFNYNRGERCILAEAFNSSGAAVVETNINACAVSTDRFLDKEEVMEIAGLLAARMEIDLAESERVENYSDDYNQLSIIGKNPHGYSTVIIVHSMDFTDIEEGPGGYETNIVVDVTLGWDYDSLLETEASIRQAIEEHIRGVRITSCIIGSYVENVPEDRMEGIIYSIFQSVNALEVERAIYDGLISISAYTPRIEQYVEMGDSRVNLNIAMRYNSFEDKTYIWLGSPVISLEY